MFTLVGERIRGKRVTRAWEAVHQKECREEGRFSNILYLWSLQLLEVKLGSVQSYPTPIVFFVYFRTILGLSHTILCRLTCPHLDLSFLCFLEFVKVLKTWDIMSATAFIFPESPLNHFQDDEISPLLWTASNPLLWPFSMFGCQWLLCTFMLNDTSWALGTWWGIVHVQHFWVLCHWLLSSTCFPYGNIWYS